jgi:hypothetical protein
MRLLGYSTGAVAPGDVPEALARLAGHGTVAVELSALRTSELEPLLCQLPHLELGAYAYVSVHAPSRFEAHEEAALVDALASRVPPAFPIVLHPDTMHDPRAWRALGRRLLLENMDQRKPTGRTALELGRCFDAVPEAGLCFDIGHARQIDRTMAEAARLLAELGVRLAQVHVSEVTASGRHEGLGPAAAQAFRELAASIPAGVPLIIEAPVTPGRIEAGLATVAEALP